MHDNSKSALRKSFTTLYMHDSRTVVSRRGSPATQRTAVGECRPSMKHDVRPRGSKRPRGAGDGSNMSSRPLRAYP